MFVMLLARLTSICDASPNELQMGNSQCNDRICLTNYIDPHWPGAGHIAATMGVGAEVDGAGGGLLYHGYIRL